MVAEVMAVARAAEVIAVLRAASLPWRRGDNGAEGGGGYSVSALGDELPKEPNDPFPRFDRAVREHRDEALDATHLAARRWYTIRTWRTQTTIMASRSSPATRSASPPKECPARARWEASRAATACARDSRPYRWPPWRVVRPRTLQNRRSHRHVHPRPTTFRPMKKFTPSYCPNFLWIEVKCTSGFQSNPKYNPEDNPTLNAHSNVNIKREVWCVFIAT